MVYGFYAVAVLHKYALVVSLIGRGLEYKARCMKGLGRGGSVEDYCAVL